MKHFFPLNISGIGPWISRTNWCEGHWSGSIHKTVQRKLKKGKNVFFGCFWAYVGQLHNHIGWATSMPFTSVNSTNPRTNPWNFHDFFWELAVLKISIFVSRPFWKKNKIKSVNIYNVARMGRYFDDYPGLHQKSKCA